MRTRLLVVAALVLALGAVVVVLVLRPTSEAPADERAATPPLSQDDVVAITENLASGDPARFPDAVLVPPDQELDPAAIPGLAALDVSIDPATFRADVEGGDTGTADATVTGPDGTVATWRVSLAHTDDRWRLVASTLVG